MSRQHRQLIEEVFAGKADRPGLWLGNPDPETIKLYTKHFDLPDMESKVKGRSLTKSPFPGGIFLIEFPKWPTPTF